LTISAKNKKFRYSENKVRLVRGGSEYFDLVSDMIRNAENTIHLQTYIFEADETGKKVAEDLMDAARRNVQVYMMVDGYASQNLPADFITALTDAGVHFRHFEPLFKSRHFYFGRRLHSKVVVADSRNVLIGGVNITNRYNDMPDQPAWLDFALYAEGPIAKESCNLCREIWRGVRHRGDVPTCEFDEKNFRFPKSEISLVRLRRNDWVTNKLQISNSYLEMFRTAEKSITILSSYALPGNVFRKRLERAIKRGVKVRMIVSGESDVLFVKHAERYWYDWLMRNNIEIYEYTKNVLHGKLAVCDGEWMTIGSYNVNDLSAYASIELNFDVRDPMFVDKVEKCLEQIIQKDCIKISKENMARTSNVFSKLGRWFSYYSIRFAFSLFTFYYRKQK
jgi:cardiolipin synthase